MMWLPCLPAGDFVVPGAPPVPWRRWAFDLAHTTFLNPHRQAGPTFHVLRRTAWWSDLVRDFNIWYNACTICQQFCGKYMPPPGHGALSSESKRSLLPWSDVYIDCTGPFTKGEDGDMYILVYICTMLGVPKLEPLKALTSGRFSRALVNCVLRSRVIPDVVRTDRGPEMTSAVMTEFLAICNTRQALGAPYTPRHQGMVERSHQETATDLLILLHKVCRAFPQEWA